MSLFEESLDQLEAITKLEKDAFKAGQLQILQELLEEVEGIGSLYDYWEGEAPYPGEVVIECQNELKDRINQKIQEIEK